jgi:hypothetical protein
MKIVATLACGLVLLLPACSKPTNNAATEMANEMCKAMELIKKDDPMSVVEAKAALSRIAKDKKKYRKVTEKELLQEMKALCPEGAAKVSEIIGKE